MDHLEEAQAAVDRAEHFLDSGRSIDVDVPLDIQRAQAHALVDIAESLRWFKKEKEWELYQRDDLYDLNQYINSP